LEQVLGEGGGMVGTAARAGGDERGRAGAQVRGEGGERVAVARELQLHHAGRFRRLAEHPGGLLAAVRGRMARTGVHASSGSGMGSGVRGRTGAVEPRTTSCGTKPWLCIGTPASLRRPAISMRAACRAMSSVACLAVVSAGHECREIGLSSKPAMDRSYGTFRPADFAAASTPAAISSLEPKIAVGGSRNDSRRRAPRKPSSKV